MHSITTSLFVLAIVWDKVVISSFYEYKRPMFQLEKKVNDQFSFQENTKIDLCSDLPLIEHASVHPLTKTIHYRLNNASFSTLKVPLCLRIEIHNQTKSCPRIVTSSGFFKFEGHQLKNILNISLCLDQYADYCGQAVRVSTSKCSLLYSLRWSDVSFRLVEHDASISWIFILIGAVTIVSCLILCGLIIFCLVVRRKRRQNNDQSIGIDIDISHPFLSYVDDLVASSMKKSSKHPVVTESVVSNTSRSDRSMIVFDTEYQAHSSPKQYFSNVTYPEDQPTPTSYSKPGEMSKLDPFQGMIRTNSDSDQNNISFFSRSNS